MAKIRKGNKCRSRVALILMVLLGLPPAGAETIRVGADGDWFSTLGGSGLKPGDEVVLEGGVYSDRRLFEMGHRGTEEKPITVRGAEGARVIFKRPDARQNSINLVGCQYFVLKNIEITGGDAGIRIRKSGEHMAKFLVLENLHIHHIGGAAITANNPGNSYEGLVFRRNHIHHTGGHGEGFYLGCNNAKDGSTEGYMFNSVVEGNYIHDLKGGTVSQGDGIEIKDGSYGNRVNDNVIHDTNYPGITIYGTDGKARNVIERNVIWNTGDNGIQAAADAEIRNNIIYDAGGDGIHCRNHQSAVVGNLEIVHNTILSGKPLRILLPDGGLSGDVLIANNAMGGPARIPENDRITAVGNVSGIRELFPTKGSKVIGAAVEDYLAEHDFDGTLWEAPGDAGAYNYSSERNDGWKIGKGFKPLWEGR